jgi:hypothetical protein
MKRIEVRTQNELDDALAKLTDGEFIVCIGDGHFTIWGSATVEASGSATVEASGSATVRAWGSATVWARDSTTVRAWGSTTVRAWGSATVWASDSATVRAWGSATVEASQWVAVHKMAPTAVIRGGVVIVSQIRDSEIIANELAKCVQLCHPPRLDSAQVWLDYHGVEVKRGIVTLYKAVDEGWHASHALPGGGLPDYSPGSKPVAPDFDAAPRDCGKGLHGCAHPSAALAYHNGPKFVAIPVRVKDLGAPDPDGDTGKIRFRCACKPVYEVDISGEAVT